MSVVEAARTDDVKRRRRSNGASLGDDGFLRGRPLRYAGELQRDARCTVGGVVRMVLVGTRRLDMGGCAARCTGLGRGRQQRRHALGSQHEAGCQNENARTRTAEALEQAVHYRKLV